MIIPFDDSWQYVSGNRTSTLSREVWVGPIDNLKFRTQEEHLVVERRMKLYVCTASRAVGMEWEYRSRTENRLR